MKKNTASQVIGCQMNSATDGSAFAGTVTVYVTGDAGTQAIGSVGTGVCTHEGNGYHTYAPATAETNYDLVAFTFIGTGAIPSTIQIYTSFPQTGDNFARLGAPAGVSVSADVAAVKAVLPSALGANGNIKADVRDYSGTAGTFAAGRPEVNTTHLAGQAVTAGAGVTFPSSVASPTNITAGTITTTTNLTNLPAITANWLTAAGIAAGALDGKGNWNIGKTGYSLTATTGLGNQTADITGNLSGSVGSVTGAVGSVTGAVGSVTGNVGGNVTGSVGSVAAGGITAASIADAAIDRATFAADTGLQAVRSNTAQAGASTTITLDASASSVTDFYKNSLVVLTGGTGVGQGRYITAYNGTTKVATVTAWATNPDATSTFAIIAADAIVGATAPTAVQVADEVQTRTIAAVTTVNGLAANVITAAATAADFTTEVTASVATAANLAVVAGYLDTEIAAIKAKTDNLPAAPAATGDCITAAGVRTAVGLASANLDTQLTAIAADAAAADTRGENVVCRGTVGTSSTTTSIITSAFSPAGAAADQFKGRIVIFDLATATAALRGQATDITASSNSATPTLTVTALTTAPASGDTFSIC